MKSPEERCKSPTNNELLITDNAYNDELLDTSQNFENSEEEVINGNGLECSQNSESNIEEMLKFKNKKIRTLATKEPTITLCKRDVLKTLKFLKEKENVVKTRRYRKLRACIKRKYATKNNSDLTLWDSPSYIIKNIRQCIMRQNWTKLPELLQILLRYPSLYHSYVKEISYLIFLIQCDNGAQQHILDDFRDLCFVSIPSKTVLDEFDVWYKED